jgi:hypothetical protein
MKRSEAYSSPGGGAGARPDIPSISRSWAWAMSSRFSPLDTANLCSWPSLSMKVTQSSSPGFGGSTCPCRVGGVEENNLTGNEGECRLGRAESRRVVEAVRVLGDIIGRAVDLPSRRILRVEVVGVEDGLRSVRARAKVRVAAMAVGEGRAQ